MEPVNEAISRILILHADPLVQRRLQVMLRRPEYEILLASTVADAVEVIQSSNPDIILAGVDTPAFGGSRVIGMMKSHAVRVPVIAIDSAPSVGHAVEAMRDGAENYVRCEARYGVWGEVVERALNESKSTKEVEGARRQVNDRYGFSQMLTRSPAMLRVFDAIRAVAPTNATVLILGETGTGKELVSRAIVARSKRASSPFVTVNCGAFSESLLESELFGHERGSFTGAVSKREGLFEMANGGTLFLDELGETSLSVQVNLLRVLESMTFRRVGGREEINVDVRIVAATHVGLEESVAKGEFREDLFYRLNVFPIHLPPLRDRREDIPLLMRYFLDEIGRKNEVDPPVVAAEAMERIVAYDWPGNVRQLRAYCERWVIAFRGGRLAESDLPQDILGGGGVTAFRGSTYIDEKQTMPQNVMRTTRTVERAYVVSVLRQCGGNIEAAAKRAGVSRRTLYTKFKQYNIDPDEFR
jgi:two-component system response regulator AtoC